MPTVLITGANRGLGLEFARQYAREGWRVIACCRSAADAPELKDLTAKDVLTVHSLDVADFAAIDRLATELQGMPIDVLINNAGYFGPKPQADKNPAQLFGHIDYEIWQQVLRINTMAPMKMAEAFITHIEASTQKKLVTISSTEGSMAKAKGGIYAYKTSKAAVNMVMRNLSIDLKQRGVITAAFCPGWVKTRMGGATAPLEAPESIAGMRKVIDGLTLETSGRFWLYNGDTVPW
jgi:NAD(P)-dependent dehydrogenase (short-subunit alcohol dehydrogenase family)